MFLQTWLSICVTIFLCFSSNSASNWTWNCVNQKCLKTRLQRDSSETPISPELCELTCNEYSRLWPMPSPTGRFEIERQVAIIDLEDGYTGSGRESQILKTMVDRFLNITSIYNDHLKNTADVEEKTRIHFEIADVINTKLDLVTDESYVLNIFQGANASAKITITAGTLFGARHALETLSQVVVGDKYQKVYVVPKRLLVEDSPVYPIRGLMVDTGHNFISIATLKRTIEGMAVNKLNTLHWHIADSDNFPYQSELLPELAQLGVFSPNMVYSRKDVHELIEWARIRGVRILPEFDGPAHVGEGWQDTDLVVCFNKQPWASYCKEPPCGQFDPTKDELYSTLKLLFRDMIDAVDPDLFHFGGDEVNFDCWNSVESIREWVKQHDFEGNYVKLWNFYQNNTYNVFMEERKHKIPGIVWSSTLTDLANLQYLPNDKYIVHVRTKASDETIKNLLENDYRMIFTNFDKLFLDCGFPYITWKQIYEHSPGNIVKDFGNDTNKPHLIMGALTALWTETVDDASAENRIWPRTSALAERVWAEPNTNWTMVEYRLNSHRDRMVKLGINADTVVPHWCYLNQNSCQTNV